MFNVKDDKGNVRSIEQYLSFSVVGQTYFDATDSSNIVHTQYTMNIHPV